MFDIEYKGGNCVVITTKKNQLVIDAHREVFGLKDISVKDATELATEKRFLTNSPEYRVSIEGPGEYEISDIAIKGVPAYRCLDDPATSPMDGNIYNVTIDNIHVGVIGNVADITDDQLEEAGLIDILIVPIGGNGYTLDYLAAIDLVRRIDPKVVIPVHYSDSSLKYEVPQDGVDTFINELKVDVVEDKKLKIKSDTTLPLSLTVYKLAFDK